MKWVPLFLSRLDFGQEFILEFSIYAGYEQNVVKAKTAIALFDCSLVSMKLNASWVNTVLQKEENFIQIYKKYACI